MPRSQRELPDDHPLKNYKTDADCVADVPERILNDLVLYYEGQDQIGEPIPDDEELV